MDWAHFLPPMITALLASFVECIEALTVVLAVGAVLGWRGVLLGTEVWRLARLSPSW